MAAASVSLSGTVVTSRYIYVRQRGGGGRICMHIVPSYWLSLPGIFPGTLGELILHSACLTPSVSLQGSILKTMLVRYGV